MINIVEQESVKAVGKTSLFIYFDYDQKIIDVLRGCGNCNYHKNIKAWESPISNLAFLIDNLTFLDKIQIYPMKDEEGSNLHLTQQYKTTPFKYQKEGIEWLINHPNSLLLDAPGLGKSIQVIYTAEELKNQKQIEHCLIICGINTLKNNWKKEIQKHSNLDCIIIGEKINSKGKITYTSIKERAEQLYNPIKEFFIIINIESLRNNTVIDAIRNSKNNFDMIAFDECHKAKSPSSDQGKNLLKLAKIGKYHYGLTGTVLVNSPLDAFVPLKFIGEEKSTYTNFKRYYCIYQNLFGHQQIAGYKNIEVLKNEINNCSLRRTKDLLDLPPKVIVPEYIDLPEAHNKFYEDLRKGITEEADRINIKTTSLLGLVTRLREAATCPTMISTKDFGNAKIERACDLVEEICSNNEKIVIFSTFKEPLYILYGLLMKYNPLLCTGDQPEEEINSNIDNFQNKDKNKIMLCTTSKMGTGITLTRASYEIFLDSNWTARLEEQCQDRCWRIGSTKSVIIYKLIARNTIDERIQGILERKKGISDYMIDNKLSENEELQYLLGLKTEL